MGSCPDTDIDPWYVCNTTLLIIIFSVNNYAQKKKMNFLSVRMYCSVDFTNFQIYYMKKSLS